MTPKEKKLLKLNLEEKGLSPEAVDKAMEEAEEQDRKDRMVPFLTSQRKAE